MMILSEHPTIYLKLIGSNGHLTTNISKSKPQVSTIECKEWQEQERRQGG